MPGREPVVLAMLTCDAIHVDPMSGKWYPLGVFTSLACDRFPFVLPRLAVYVCLTECAGRVPVALRVVDVDEARPPVVDVAVEFPVLDPLAESQMDITLGDLTFPELGV